MTGRIDCNTPRLIELPISAALATELSEICSTIAEARIL
jgi:hypothetical protein